MNKSRHFKKTQNELKVLSPSPALVQRHGKEGPAQTAPGLGKSRRQTRFNFFFLPYYHWRHISRTRNSQKIIRSQPSTVKIKEKNISSILNLLIIKTVCIIPSYYLNRRIEAELEECGDVVITGSTCFCRVRLVQAVTACYSLMVPVGKLLLHSL